MTEWEDILKQKRRKPPIREVGALDSMKEMNMKEEIPFDDSKLEDEIAEASREDLIQEFVKIVSKLSTEDMKKLLVASQGDFSKVI